MKTMSGDNGFKANPNIVRQLSVVAGVTALILLVPLVAMQFTKEVAWTLSDFVVAAVLLSGTGFMYVLFSRMVASRRHRIVVGAVLAAALVLVWLELAVGIIGTLPFSGS
jgi:hypothetical protein